MFRGVGKGNLPGYVGFFQFLRNFRQHNACEQAELILRAALDPTVASRAKKGEFVICFDHFDLLQTAINCANHDKLREQFLRQIGYKLACRVGVKRAGSKAARDIGLLPVRIRSAIQ